MKTAVKVNCVNSKIWKKVPCEWVEAWGHCSEAKSLYCTSILYAFGIFAKSMMDLLLDASGANIWQKMLSTALLITDDSDISIS